MNVLIFVASVDQLTGFLLERLYIVKQATFNDKYVGILFSKFLFIQISLRASFLLWSLSQHSLCFSFFKLLQSHYFNGIFTTQQESRDENEKVEVYPIPFSEDETSQEGSSITSESHFVSLSKKPKMSGGKTLLPVLSKCDRMVQANMDQPQDCDEFYFMNLVKVFKKLSPHKKTEVRMKIERILFEAEFQ